MSQNSIVTLPFNPNRGIFIFSGDSEALPSHYPFYFASTYPWSSYVSLNYATGGVGVANVVGNFTSQIQPYVQAYTSNSIVSIQIGTNDIGALSSSAFITSSLITAWNQVRSNGGKVMAWTILWSGNWANQSASLSLQSQINNFIYSSGNLYDYLVDGTSYLTNPFDTYLFLDGTHLTQAGDALVMGLIDASLKTNVSASSSIVYPASSPYFSYYPSQSLIKIGTLTPSTNNALVASSILIGTSAGQAVTNTSYATIIGCYAGINSINANSATLIGANAGQIATSYIPLV